MGVCKRPVVRFPFFFAPRSLQAEKAKGQGGPPWPFSRGCQTYWEACQKCGADLLLARSLPVAGRRAVRLRIGCETARARPRWVIRALSKPPPYGGSRLLFLRL